MNNLSIGLKVGVAIIGVTLVTLVTTLVLARWSFEVGFLEYANSQELERLDRTAIDLARAYEQVGTWSDLMDHPLVRDIQRSGHQDVIPGGPPHDAKRHAMRQRPRHEVSRRPPPAHQPAGRRPPPRGAVMPPTELRTQDGTVLAGYLPAGVESLQVDIRLGEAVIGTLVTPIRQGLSRSSEAVFSAQQIRATWGVAAVALLVAILITSLLARALVRPVRQAKADIEKLRDGDFELADTAVADDELGELSRDIRTLANTLQENKSARQRWMADISHELRTPVATLRAEMDALLDGLREISPKRLDSLSEEISRIDYLVEDLYQLSLSDLGALRYEFAPIDAAEVMRGVIDSLEAPHDLNIHSSIESALIRGDGQRLHQLFSNLLCNSVAYTQIPGEVRISVEKLRDVVICTIEDSAPGVDAEQCHQLFEPLYRMDSARDRRTGGAGLGLAIAANIVAAHEGKIVAKPSGLGGLRIEVEFYV